MANTLETWELATVPDWSGPTLPMPRSGVRGWLDDVVTIPEPARRRVRCPGCGMLNALTAAQASAGCVCGVCAGEENE